MRDDEREPEGELRSAESLSDSGNEPRGWDRASIRLRTHPNHEFPTLVSTDLLLPTRQDPLRFAGDCVVVGVAFALLAFFPLLLVALATPHQLGSWFWWAMIATGGVGAFHVFWCGRSLDTRDLDSF